MKTMISVIKSIYDKLKKVAFLSPLLPSKDVIKKLRHRYRSFISFPFFFYILHPLVLSKGVLFGTFIGTRLQAKTSWCVAPYFFLGTYEKELQSIWSELLQFKSQEWVIWVIGASEGYYACGLGRIFQKSEIFAYETLENSRQILANNININELSERVTILGSCEHGEFSSKLKHEQPNFILCDIEGYEDTLFSLENISLLENTILVIETHPPYGLLKLIPNLQKTHRVLRIEPQARTLQDYQGFPWLPNSKKYRWLNENRPFPTPWIFAVPKNLELSK